MVVGPSRPLVVAVTRTMFLEVHGPVELAAPVKADERSSSVEDHQASVQLLLMRVVDALGPLEEPFPGSARVAAVKSATLLSQSRLCSGWTVNFTTMNSICSSSTGKNR